MTRKQLIKDFVSYLKEASILLGGLIILELIIVFPDQLSSAGFDLDTMTYAGETSIIRAFGLALLRAIGVSSFNAIKKVTKK
jgi:hypothetical protein